jgi:dihydroxyacetone kinase-like predicted kinase
MCESALHVVAGEVTRAVRDTSTDAGEVHVGDWIGLGDHGVRSVADSIASAANQLLATLVKPEHELITIIEGDGSTPANTRRITEYLADEFPSLSVEVHQGGQPLYPYYFGIE